MALHVPTFVCRFIPPCASSVSTLESAKMDHRVQYSPELHVGSPHHALTEGDISSEIPCMDCIRVAILLKMRISNGTQK